MIIKMICSSAVTMTLSSLSQQSLATAYVTPWSSPQKMLVASTPATDAKARMIETVVNMDKISRKLLLSP